MWTLMIMPSYHHEPSLHLISTLMNMDIDNEEESIESESQNLTTLN